MWRAFVALAFVAACEVEPPGHGHTTLHLHFEGAGYGEVTVTSLDDTTVSDTCAADCTLEYSNDLQLMRCR